MKLNITHREPGLTATGNPKISFRLSVVDNEENVVLTSRGWIYHSRGLKEPSVRVGQAYMRTVEISPESKAAIEKFFGEDSRTQEYFAAVKAQTAEETREVWEGSVEVEER
jgi:hypothetical protein